MKIIYSHLGETNIINIENMSIKEFSYLVEIFLEPQGINWEYHV